jgi:hypothetical protein
VDICFLEESLIQINLGSDRQIRPMMERRDALRLTDGPGAVPQQIDFRTHYRERTIEPTYTGVTAVHRPHLSGEVDERAS